MIEILLGSSRQNSINSMITSVSTCLWRNWMRKESSRSEMACFRRRTLSLRVQLFIIQSASILRRHRSSGSSGDGWTGHFRRLSSTRNPLSGRSPNGGFGSQYWTRGSAGGARSGRALSSQILDAWPLLSGMRTHYQYAVRSDKNIKYNCCHWFTARIRSSINNSFCWSNLILNDNKWWMRSTMHISLYWSNTQWILMINEFGTNVETYYSEWKVSTGTCIIASCYANFYF